MFAGSRQIQVEDAANHLSFPVWVQYPTETPSSPTAFGPYLLDVSPDAPLAPLQTPLPLAVISHGNGGSPLLYRSISSHLAKNGYLVALPEHPGNNRNDNRWKCTIENLTYRPRHLSLAIDAIFADAEFTPAVRRDKVAAIGHSIGGYTALAVAGGEPRSETGERVEVVADSRIGAIVLLAPATAWYLGQDSLRSVKVPILMLQGEKDTITPSWHGDIVLEGAADRALVTDRTIENAGHFSFLAPFPPTLKSPNFLPSTDPEGFDRDRFHEELPGEILAYLNRVLSEFVEV